jgi:hypothetical protein
VADIRGTDAQGLLIGPRTETEQYLIGGGPCAIRLRNISFLPGLRWLGICGFSVSLCRLCLRGFLIGVTSLNATGKADLPGDRKLSRSYGTASNYSQFR